MSGVHGQRGLADPGRPANRRHHHPPAVRQPGQPRQLILPAGEGGHVPRQQPRHPETSRDRTPDVDDSVIPGGDDRLVPARGIHIPATARPLADPILLLAWHQDSFIPAAVVDDRLVMPGHVDVPACPRLLHQLLPAAAI
jgi:hypothetical protein